MSFFSFIQKVVFWITVFWISGCQANHESSRQTSESVNTEKASESFSQKKENKKSSKQKADRNIPEKVYFVLDYVKKHNKAPEGYIGGRRFGNFEKRLPLEDQNTRPMKYREWDVNPKKQGKNRGAERLITSQNERAWYTRDHYETFTEIK